MEHGTENNDSTMTNMVPTETTIVSSEVNGTNQNQAGKSANIIVGPLAERRLHIENIFSFLVAC